MVKSNKVYSPQNFVEALTGQCYIFDGHNVIEQIHSLLRKHGIEDDECETIWDYPLNEISEALEADVDVVLVDVSGFNEKDEWVNEYRWFEIHSDIEGSDINNEPQDNDTNHHKEPHPVNSDLYVDCVIDKLNKLKEKYPDQWIVMHGNKSEIGFPIGQSEIYKNEANEIYISHIYLK